MNIDNLNNDDIPRYRKKRQKKKIILQAKRLYEGHGIWKYYYTDWTTIGKYKTVEQANQALSGMCGKFLTDMEFRIKEI